MFYSRNKNTSGNIIKHNLPTSMKERSHFFIKISLSFYSRKGPILSCWFEIDREIIYSERGFLLPITSSRSQGVPTLESSSETPLLCSMSLVRLRFSAFWLNLTAWFSSRGFLPVTHLFDLSALIVLSCLLNTTWQLVKAHGVTRNKPKIHGLC